MATQEMSERTKLIITIVVVLLINGGAWGYVYTLNKEHNRLLKHQLMLTTQVETLEAEAAQRRGKELELKKIESKNVRQLKKLPGIMDPEQFMEDLSALAVKTGVRIDGVLRPELGLPTGVLGLGPEFQKDKYHARYKASFNGICEFMNFLEEYHQWFVGLENFSLKASANGLGVTGAIHSVNFTVTTYRYMKR